MLRNLLAIAIGINLLFTNCRTKDNNPLKDFINLSERRISGEGINLVSDTILFRPYNLQVYDTLAVINDNTGEAGYSIINIKTGRLVRKFAFSGIDSSEFDINAISMGSEADNKSVFTITQINSPNKVFRYQWDSLMNNPGYKPSPLYYPEKFWFRNSLLLNDSMLFGRFFFSKFDNKMFGIVNTTSNKLITGIEVPGVNVNTVNRSYEDSPYYKWMNRILDDNFVYRPGSNYEFACFSFRGAIVQIFNIDKDYRFKIKYEKDYSLPTFSLIEKAGIIKPRTDPDSKLGFASISATRDKIYALFNGRLLNNSEENKDASDIVLVYDWNGNPLEKIQLDRKCGRIAIDGNNPTLLYGLYGTMNAQIVRFRLP